MSEVPIPENDIERILLWDRHLDDFNYFELLGVAETCSELQVDEAYHQFARLFHPDNFPCTEPPVQTALNRLFQRAVEARQVLSDAELRAKYRELVQFGINRLPEELQRQILELANVDLDDELPNLHLSCRSAGAKLRAMAAANAWRRGNADEVIKALTDALTFDAQANPAIERCLRAMAGRTADAH